MLIVGPKASASGAVSEPQLQPCFHGSLTVIELKWRHADREER
jgi:hypothetical protein